MAKFKSNYESLLKTLRRLPAESPAREPPNTDLPIVGGDPISYDHEVDFELVGELSFGGIATAKIREWRGGGLVTTELEITVQDVIGTMRGVPGDFGIAGLIIGSDPVRWRVKQLRC